MDEPLNSYPSGPLVSLLLLVLVLFGMYLLLPPLPPEPPEPTPAPTVDDGPATATLTPPSIGTPMISPTVTMSPPIVTATVTNTPHVAPSVEVVTPNVRTPTPNVPETGTPAPDSKTPTATGIPNIPTATHTPGIKTPVVGDNCRRGVITAHAAIDQVLATKPDRACDGCVYYASVLCQDIGKDMTLRIGISLIPIRVVDCATWGVGAWPQKAGQDWLGELDIDSWPEGAPMAPLEAELCPMAAPRGRQ